MPEGIIKRKSFNMLKIRIKTTDAEVLLKPERKMQKKIL